jgi:hypothetical protein
MYFECIVSEQLPLDPYRFPVRLLERVRFKKGIREKVELHFFGDRCLMLVIKRCPQR